MVYEPILFKFGKKIYTTNLGIFIHTELPLPALKAIGVQESKSLKHHLPYKIHIITINVDRIWHLLVRWILYSSLSCMINIRGRGLYFSDFIEKYLELRLTVRSLRTNLVQTCDDRHHQCFSFRSSWTTLTFIQGHRVTRKLKHVQSFQHWVHEVPQTFGMVDSLKEMAEE